MPESAAPAAAAPTVDMAAAFRAFLHTPEGRMMIQKEAKAAAAAAAAGAASGAASPEELQRVRAIDAFRAAHQNGETKTQSDAFALLDALEADPAVASCRIAAGAHSRRAPHPVDKGGWPLTSYGKRTVSTNPDAECWRTGNAVRFS